jgi:glycerate-2-kinase
LQEVRDAGAEVGVLALEACGEVLEGDARNVGEVRRAEPDERILIEEGVEPGDLANGGEAAFWVRGGSKNGREENGGTD